MLLSQFVRYPKSSYPVLQLQVGALILYSLQKRQFVEVDTQLAHLYEQAFIYNMSFININIYVDMKIHYSILQSYTQNKLRFKKILMDK
jgi:hypothetical protein